MARALENPETDPSYLEFFGLTRPPFAQLSEPSEIFLTEQYSLLMDHLVAATEQSDCLVVICGADGSGKTTLLNRHITSLGEDVSFVAIDETCNGEKKFYCTILKQLGFGEIAGTPGELRRISKEFLVNRGMADDPVLMLIDNAHLINPNVLEQLRRISATKVNDRRVLSVVLAGNSDLARIMDSPAMSQIKFHSQVRFNIRVYTEEETANYVSHRLKLAGSNDDVSFSDDAAALIYRYTGGTPSLINTLCNAVLTESYALDSHVITEDLVRRVADGRRLMPHVVPLQGKGRRRTDPDFKSAQPERQSDERITARDASTKESLEKPMPRSAEVEFDVENLLKRISQLSEQLGELKADRKRALEDIGARDKDISHLKPALADATKALRKAERTSTKLTKGLQKEKNATKTARADIAKAKAKIKELSRERTKLQTSVSNLTADLRSANKQLAKVDVLEEDAAALKDEAAKKDARIVDLEAELDSYSRGNTKTQAWLPEIPKIEQSPKSEPGFAAEQTDAPIANFEVVKNGKVEQVLEIVKGMSRIMIGRSEDSDLRLDSEFVSRHHALIFCTGDDVYIEDLNSFNGTMVNFEKITRCNLRPGDNIILGDFQVRPRQA